MLSDTARIFGLAGTGGITLAIVISAFLYRGRRGERYSLLNHFISELGEVGVSPAAQVFNKGLLIGGLLLTPFMVGLGVAFHNLWGWLGLASGVVASLGVAAVGWYPMNNLKPHVRAAMTYFRSGLVMVGCFGVAILTQPATSQVLPPTANLFSLLAALSYASFLWLLGTPPKKGDRSVGEILNPQVVPERPRVWKVALLEWIVFFSTVIWIFGVAVAE